MAPALAGLTSLAPEDPERPVRPWPLLHTAGLLEDGLPAPDILIVEPDVSDPFLAARQAMERWRHVRFIFLATAERHERLSSGLPFIPDLAGSMVIGEESDEAIIRQAADALALATRRERASSRLFERLNAQIGLIGVQQGHAQHREARLALAERYLASILQSTSHGLLATTGEGVIVASNAAADAMLGADRLIGGERRLQDLIEASGAASVADLLQQAARGKSGHVEVGTLAGRVAQISAAPVLAVDGSVAGVSVDAIDLTDLRRIEAQLEDVNRRLTTVLDNATVAIFVMDDTQACVYMNGAAEMLTGFRLEDVHGRPLHDVIHHTRPDGSPYPLDECPIDRAFPENARQQGEEIFVHRDGGFYPVAFTASPIRNEAARTVGTIIEVRDISEEKRNEAARELLMREVDHRSRNVLTVVQSMIQLTSAESVEAYREILVGRIGALARAQGSLASAFWEGASLRELAESELEALGRAEGYSLEGPNLMLSPDQVQPLSMVLHELATNAAKYGAFSAQNGHVDLSWSARAGRLWELVWRERDGPPIAGPPGRQGFGSRLMRQLARQLEATIAFDWNPLSLVVRLSLAKAPRPAHQQA